MIDRVRFESFKSLASVTLDFGPLTVLVGPNGCGKSSVLQGMELLAKVVAEHGQPYHRLLGIFSGLREPGRLAPERPTQMLFSMRETQGDDLQLRVLIPAPTENRPDNGSPRFTVSVNGPAGQIAVTAPSALGKRAEQTKALAHPRLTRFGSLVYLHLDASEMIKTSSTDDEEPRVGANGSGLGSALAWMAGAAPDTLTSIATDLAKAVPGVRRILTYRERITERVMEQISIDGQPVWRPVDRARMGDRFAIEFDVGGPVPADLLSEGTVLALGLLTKLHEPDRPRLVLLDDIDRGLHIDAQSKLVEVLRELMEHDPELQIVCTTHSPYLLDRFDPAEVRVLSLDANRHTQALPLTAHPEFDKWKFGVQTGELWAALGSAWVAGPEGLPK
jgi:energy-coupling factor transporter ATP-binding protein EcfA2